jgi:hypothetical protein
LTRLAEPFLATAEELGELGRCVVGVLLQHAAAVFLDDGVEVLVRAGDGIERVEWRRAPVLRERVVVKDFD